MIQTVLMRIAQLATTLGQDLPSYARLIWIKKPSEAFLIVSREIVLAVGRDECQSFLARLSPLTQNKEELV